MTIAMVVVCTLVAYLWNQTIPGGYCLDFSSIIDFFMITGAINMVTEIVVLCLPLPVVWNLNMSKNRKIGLSFAFALGGFACIAGIIRVIYLPKMDPADITCM